MVPAGSALTPRLSLVIPAFNEAERLPPTLTRVFAHLGSAPAWLPAEVVVVDDGSGDGTAAAVRALPAPPPGVVLRVEVHAVNRGKGAAVRTGFAASRGQLVLLSDADLSTPIGELDRLALDHDGAAVVIGSPLATGPPRRGPTPGWAATGRRPRQPWCTTHSPALGCRSFRPRRPQA